MVQDPHCGTYLPMNEAIHVRSRGEDLYFCSKECRDAYLISARENGKD
ncbi:TRASH domain-containing protein [Dethiosulfatarculus sandiegensis]|uniref:TRASH domain-containing protein n=2 Tax=Dethiosulfatarculus sandiegensis TaxID=1429043 RepID=A0A0D2JQC8_9BACT|nr:TRASH domain-containing protein [Dethiosulfatarculus sandiegensis]